MDTLIIYASIHHKNTKKIAQAIHKKLGGRLVSVDQVDKGDIENADLIGFGSGIYMAKFHKSIPRLIKNIDQAKNKKAFIFSTAGSKNVIFNRGHKAIKKRLRRKGFEIVGEFECLGYDSFGPLKFFGGINKGRPNEKDLEKAEEFAKKIINKEDE